MKSLFRRRAAATTLKFISAFSLVAIPGSASAGAYDWDVEAHVVVIETSYVGWTHLYFSIDRPAGTSCAAGTWLMWNTNGNDEPSQLANVQAQLSVLEAAKLSGKTIHIFGWNSGCSVSYMWLTG